MFIIGIILLLGGFLSGNLDRLYCFGYALKKKFIYGSDKLIYNLYREKISISPFAEDDNIPNQLNWSKYPSSIMIISGITCCVLIPFSRYIDIMDLICLFIEIVVLVMLRFVRWKYIVNKMQENHFIYANSKNYRIREVVAYMGFDVDTLKHDESSLVRWQLAFTPQYANEFLNDVDNSVRDVATWRCFYSNKPGCETYTRYLLELYKEDYQNQWPNRIF